MQLSSTAVAEMWAVSSKNSRAGGRAAGLVSEWLGVWPRTGPIPR